MYRWAGGLSRSFIHGCSNINKCKAWRHISRNKETGKKYVSLKFVPVLQVHRYYLAHCSESFKAYQRVAALWTSCPKQTVKNIYEKYGFYVPNYRSLGFGRLARDFRNILYCDLWNSWRIFSTVKYVILVSNYCNRRYFFNDFLSIFNVGNDPDAVLFLGLLLKQTLQVV